MTEDTTNNEKNTTESAAEAPVEPSAEAKLSAELEAWKNKYLYLSAELDNVRKRFARERLDLLKGANEDLLRTLLPVFDNLKFAVSALKESESKLEKSVRDNAVFANLCKGVEMTLKHFENTLEQVGVKPIPAQGKSFDPNLHEAMGEAQDASLPEGHVASEMQSGFTLGERVLRPARVLVNKLGHKIQSNGANGALKGE